MSLDNGQDMLAHVRQCEVSGVYDERFNEINSIYSANFNNRHKGCNFDSPDMQNGANTHINV